MSKCKSPSAGLSMFLLVKEAYLLDLSALPTSSIG